MNVKRYRKKPVIIEALQWTGDNTPEIKMFCGEKAIFVDNNGKLELRIKTLEGMHIATIGDYIIKGIEGEFYPCKESIFKKTYELISNSIESELGYII